MNSINSGPESYCRYFGHDYAKDQHKSQFYPRGYIVEKCENCGDLTLTYMMDKGARFEQQYGESPLEFLSK
jgi:hypothetical protein